MGSKLGSKLILLNRTPDINLTLFSSSGSGLKVTCGDAAAAAAAYCTRQLGGGGGGGEADTMGRDDGKQAVEALQGEGPVSLSLLR